MTQSFQRIGTTLLVLFLGMLSVGPAMAQAAVTVRLEPYAGSNVSGTAILSADGNGTRVTLDLAGLEPGTNVTATMHAGPCATPGASGAQLPALVAGADGKAVATGRVLFRGAEQIALADIADGAHSISISGPADALACGTIPSLAAAPDSLMPATGRARSPVPAGLLISAALFALAALGLPGAWGRARR